MKKYQPMQNKRDFNTYINDIEKMIDTIHDKRKILRIIDIPPGKKFTDQLNKTSIEEIRKQNKISHERELDELNPTRKISLLLAQKEKESDANGSDQDSSDFSNNKSHTQNKVRKYKEIKQNSTQRGLSKISRVSVENLKNKMSMTNYRFGKKTQRTPNVISPKRREAEIMTILNSKVFLCKLYRKAASNIGKVILLSI
jgi:hypothetical protein